ncbi:MAG: PEP-CTERM sorting domain-containing protein [Armatimonadota bacterium]|nr:PEP-CTERM sorting domain-containing protein [Armatimonadota bacterium]
MRTALICLCLLAMTSSGYASVYGFDVGYRIRSADSGESSGVKRGFAGGYTGYSDADDGEGRLISLPAVSAGIRKVTGVEGWDGPTTFIMWDYRSALAEGERKTEDIFVWANPGTQSQDILFYREGSQFLPTGVSYKLSLVSVPNGVTYTGPTQWGPDQGMITLPFYSTDDPLTGYRFLAEVSAIPEPSSSLGLLAGLAGFSGLVLRRRRI